MKEIIVQHPIQFGFWTLILLGMIPLWIYILAKKGIGWVMIPEGQIMVIVEGNTVHKFIGRIKDYSVHPTTGVLTYTGGATPVSGWYGISWIGIPPFRRVYTYKFRWNKWSKADKTATKNSVMPKEDLETHSVFFRAPYAIEITDAETSDGAKMNIQLLISVQAENVECMLFKTPDWLANLTAKITDVTAKYMRSQTSVDFRSDTVGKVNELSLKIMELNTTPPTVDPQSLRSLIGVSIVSADFLGYDMAGGLAEAAERTAKAQLEGEANLKAAELAAQTLEKSTEAQARAMERMASAKKVEGMAEVDVVTARYERLQKHDPQAKRSLAEAIEKHKGTLVLGGGAQLLVSDDGQKGGTP